MMNTQAEGSNPSEIKNFAISMTAELLKRIDDEAKRQRRSRSSLVRIIVEDYLNEKAQQ